MTQELKTKRPIEEARERLKLLSLEVKDLVEDGTFDTINTAIMETMYKDRTHRSFDTYMGWKLKGKRVKKGEKAFLLWSKPKNIAKDQPPQEETEENPTEDEYRFYGIAYLFSNAQVEDMPVPETAPVEEPKRELATLPYE